MYIGRVSNSVTHIHSENPHAISRPMICEKIRCTCQLAFELESCKHCINSLCTFQYICSLYYTTIMYTQVMPCYKSVLYKLIHESGINIVKVQQTNKLSLSKPKSYLAHTQLKSILWFWVLTRTQRQINMCLYLDRYLLWITSTTYNLIFVSLVDIRLTTGLKYSQWRIVPR